MYVVNRLVNASGLKAVLSRNGNSLYQIAFKSTQSYVGSNDGKETEESSRDNRKHQIKWFYAADIPKRKPSWVDYKQEKEPGKFLPFSEDDSRRLEEAYLKKSKNTVEVNEDKLFEVNFEELEMAPVYWDGPIYEVRRGLWFKSNGVPLGSKETEAIEKGYQQVKPYNFKQRKSIKTTKSDESAFKNSVYDDISKKESNIYNVDDEQDIIPISEDKLVLYFDGKNAAIVPASFNMKFQINAIRNFGPNSMSMLSIDYIQRGYSEEFNDSVVDKVTSQSVPEISKSIKEEVSSFFSSSGDEKPISQSQPGENNQEENEENRKMKEVMESDFDSEAASDRDVEHLVLCVHGIGQILGQKYESINFAHSINVLRNTMKSVYESNKEYQELAYGSKTGEDSLSNNKIQALPISWRHKMDFQPHKPFEKYDDQGEYRLPMLSQINVDGVKSLRSILGDVVLDVLLLYEAKYRHQLIDVVIGELNRVYRLYKERNPDFNGKVHIMGHSLGSAIAFEILCLQNHKDIRNEDKQLDFDVENLFCVGSPTGVFKLLEQENIKSRSLVKDDFNPFDSSLDFSSPKCENLYNIFHPCDPVGYRMEPLIRTNYSNFKPQPIPFAMKGINTQMKELSDLGDEISEKIALASKWFSKSQSAAKLMISDERVGKENALGDIITSIATDKSKDDKNNKHKVVSSTEFDVNDLISMNRTGRVDYALPMGVFDISLISAVSAHVSYFEDADTAGFIMREILSSHLKPVESRNISVYS